MIAKLSIILGGLGLLSWLIFIVIFPPDILVIFYLSLFGFLCTLGAVILVSISIFKSICNDFDDFIKTSAGFILSLLSIGALLYVIFFIFVPQIHFLRRSAYLSEIGIGLELYKQNHSGKLPTDSTWCDTLIHDGYVTEQHLTITARDKSKRNCALNMNALDLDDVPDDMVLIFESGPGWNLVGDKESVVYDDYKGGCLIIFGDIRTEYLMPEDIPNLRWTVEEE